MTRRFKSYRSSFGVLLVAVAAVAVAGRSRKPAGQDENNPIDKRAHTEEHAPK